MTKVGPQTFWWLKVWRIRQTFAACKGTLIIYFSYPNNLLSIVSGSVRNEGACEFRREQACRILKWP